MADNTSVLGLNYVKVPTGTTAERPVSPAIGYTRYNTTIGYLEYYGSNGWSAVAAPPTVSSVSPSSFNGEGGTTITINGANFDSTATVVFNLAGGGTANASATTRISASQLTATTPRDFLASESPAGVKVVNGSGLSYVLDTCLSFGDTPQFVTASGSIGSLYDSGRTIVAGALSSLAATDSNGGSIDLYSIVSGSLPPGVTFNTSNASLSGTASAVGSDTTYSFTVRARDNAGNTTDRAFSLTVRAPIVVTYTSGSGNFAVPTGTTSVRVLVIAGGGGGGTRNAGRNSGGTDGGAGGGAGGMIDHPGFPVTPGGSVPWYVGTGGGGGGDGYGSGQTPGGKGNNSGFGSLTAIGGGYGACGPLSPNPGGPGGSGGGEGGGGGSTGGTGARGVGVQPQQGGDSGTYGYGNPGGYCSVGGNPPYTGSSGGGAGGGGNDGNSGRVTPGGDGRVSTITGSSITYAGGGGGGGSANGGNPGGGGGPGGGGAGGTNPGHGSNGADGYGGGGGGGAGTPWPDGAGGNGGSGVVIVRY